MMKLPVAFSILLCTACAHAASNYLEIERERLLRVSSSAGMAFTTGMVTNQFHGEACPVEYAGQYLLA